MKASIILLMSLVLIGCGTIEKRHLYAPQNEVNWKSFGNKSSKFVCNRGEIQVTPIVLHTTEVQAQEKPWLYIRLQATSRIQNCDLLFLSLENKLSKQQISPISAKTHLFNDNHLKIKTTDCYYYFDMSEDKGSVYDLYISDKVLNCKVDPISYRYQEATEWVPIQLQ